MAQLINEEERVTSKAVGTISSRLNGVEEKKGELQSLKKDIKQYARDLEAKGRAYDKIGLRADEKPSSRNLNKLSRAKGEFEESKQLMLKGVKIARDTVASIQNDLLLVAEAYYSGANKSKAKKYSRMAERFAAREDAEIDKLALAVGEYTLGQTYTENEESAPDSNEVKTESSAQQARLGGTSAAPQPQYSAYPQQQYVPYPPFYFLPAYCDPSAFSQQNNTAGLTDEVRSAIKEAVSERVAPLIKELEERLLAAVSEIKINRAASEVAEQAIDAEVQYVADEEPTVSVEGATVEIPDACVSADEPEVLSCTDDAAESESEPAIAECEPSVESNETAAATLTKITEILGAIETVVRDAEAINKRVAEISEAQRNVIDMQRAFARDMQGVQVKQKLVNSDQTELVEAQEVVLQHQKLIREQHEALFSREDEALAAVSELIAKQGEVESAIKTSIQTQKSIIQANVKNGELQRELLEKQNELAKTQKQSFAAQRQLARALNGRKKTDSTEGEIKTDPDAE